MADILLMAVNKRNLNDATKDEVAMFKRGDPVVVRPTGWEWGRLEVVPPAEGGDFARIRLLRNDGVTPVWSAGDEPPGRLREICESIERSDLVFEEYPDGTSGPGVQTRARAWRVLVNDLPPAVLQTLNQIGLYEVTVGAVRTYIQNKLTLANPTDADLGEA
jgi:hypothetical protein